MPKVMKNVEVLKAQTNNVKAEVNAVLSSLVIAYVFAKYEVKLKDEHYKALLKCLKLPANEEVCSEFIKSVNEFGNDILR